MEKEINLKKEDVGSILSKTYSLLAMTLFFSAALSGVGILLNLGIVSSMVFAAISFILIFIIPKVSKGEMALFLTFLFSGTMGLSLSSFFKAIISHDHGPTIIIQSLIMTGIIFFSLSAYVLKTKKDFSFLDGFLTVGIILAILILTFNFFFGSTMIMLIANSFIVLIMSGYILYDTSRIINGGEKSYIMATISLYLNIVNIFVSLIDIIYTLIVMEND